MTRRVRRVAAAVSLLLLLELPLQAGEPVDLFRTASTVAGTVLGAGGQLAATTFHQVGDAATQVYEDASGGRFLFVASPVRQALMVAPQVHTAVRNSLEASRNARLERAQSGQKFSLARFRPAGWERPVTPTRQVIARQFASPFRPSNMLFTVGATAVGGLIQAALDEDMTWRDAFSFMGDRSFWGGVVGSGIGYAVASLAALALLPAGGTLLPVLAPMIVGTFGSVIGWTLGAALGEGESFHDSLERLSVPGIVGKSIGSALGILAGVALGAAIGGPVGAVVGPIGAVVGTLLLRNLGQAWADDTFGPRPEDGAVDVAETTEGLLVPLDSRYRETYTSLVTALENDDREAAAGLLETLRQLAEEDGRAQVVETTEAELAPAR